MLTMEYIKENEKTYQVQIEELTNRVEYEQRRNQRKDKEIERLSKEIVKYDELLCNRNNEIERLNNIIKDLVRFAWGTDMSMSEFTTLYEMAYNKEFEGFED